MHFYTSVNINYLPKARILAKSVKRFCPNSEFTLVFSDKWPGEIDKEKEPFDHILLIEDLGIAVDNLSLWIFEHTVVELCTAVKGQALVKLLDEGAEKVVYLDPDTVLFNDMHEMDELLEQYDVVLTPHLTEQEYEKRGILDNEICTLQHGAYNFGFYAVKNSENGLKFAKWWRDRLNDFCFDDIPGGIFTDQKWGDLVPSLFDGVFITRDPGYNVSTWNISNRKLTRAENGSILVNNIPLKFYHFSGFDSGAQAEMLDRYSSGNEILYDLRQWYIKRQKEEEQEKYEKYPSAYNFYSDGTKIGKRERMLLHMRMDVRNFFIETNPYIVDQEKSYKNWYLAEEKRYENDTLKTKEELAREIDKWKKDYENLNCVLNSYKSENILRRLKRCIKGDY